MAGGEAVSADTEGYGNLAALMRGGGGFAAGLDFFEEPDEGDAAEAEQGDPAEDIDEGPEARLLEDLLVDLGVGSGGSLCRA